MKYAIDGKLTHIVSDNASNMRKAFEVHFFRPDANVDEEWEADESTPFVDEPFLWQDSDNGLDELHLTHPVNHIRCFAHTLQLAIRDGLKHVKSLHAALGKCSRIATLLHSSSPTIVSPNVTCYYNCDDITSNSF